MTLAIEAPLGLLTEPRRPALAPRHLKTSSVGSLEPCEDADCSAGADGVASSCGRLACPACGCSGVNLSTMQLAHVWQGLRVACSCGYSWIPLRGRRPLIVTAAELAECACPDPCDRDHGNE